MSSDAQERGMVKVQHFVFSHSLPVAGLTVGVVRGELAERTNINPAAVGHIDGEPADESTVLTEGQVLCFINPTGFKS